MLISVCTDLETAAVLEQTPQIAGFEAARVHADRFVVYLVVRHRAPVSSSDAAAVKRLEVTKRIASREYTCNGTLRKFVVK